MMTGQLEPADLGTLVEELCDMSSKWELFGLQLGIQHSTLKIFRRLNPAESLQSLRDTLEEWLNNSQPTTWLEIVKALKSKSVGEGRLASVIQDKYCSTHDVTISGGENQMHQIVYTLTSMFN